MTTSSDLLEQYFDNRYRDMLFSVYNYLDECDYVAECSASDGKEYGFDDFEFIKFNIEKDESTVIKSEKRGFMFTAHMRAKYDIENLMENKGRHCAFMTLKDFGMLIAVRLKKNDNV